MKTILPSQKIKQFVLFLTLIFCFSMTNGYGQESGTDGDYCPAPGASGDEYGTGVFFSQVLNPSPSSTCQIGTIRAKVDTGNEVLKLGMNIGNGGAALFRLYLDTDNDSSTGLTSDDFGGSLTVSGAEYILEINSNASTFIIYTGNGSTKTNITGSPSVAGLEAHSGSPTGCGSGDGFLEFNIPFGSIGFNICDVNNPGVINITKLASVSGNNESSNRCINTPLTFGIPLTGSVSPDASVCSGTNSTLLTVSGLATGSTVDNWQYSISPFTTWTDIPDTPTTTYTPTDLTQTTKFRAVFSNSGLCSGNGIVTGSATITVNPTPTVNSVNNQTICKDAMTAAVTFSGTATSYSWTNSNTAIGLAASGNGNIAAFAGTNTTSAPISGTITVTPHYLTNGVNCEGATTSFTITVNPAPTVNSVNNQTICKDAMTTAVTFSGTATSYSWTNSNPAIGLAASGNGNIAAFAGTNTTSAPISGTITVTPHYLTNGVNCNGTTSSFTITVNPLPTVTISGTTAVCKDTTTPNITFTGTNGTAPYTFTYNINGGTNLTVSTTMGNSVTVDASTSTVGTFTYNLVSVQDASNTTCSQAQNGSATITVNPLPSISTSATAASVCFSTNAQSTILAFTTTSETPTSYSIIWNNSPTNNFASITDAPLSTSPITIAVPAGTAAGTYTATIIVKNANGCISTPTTFTLTVNTCLISMVKQAELHNTGNCTAVGDKITYTFTVTNPGTTPISNILITDKLLSAPNPIVPINFVNGDTNGDMSLDGNETWIFTADYVITQNDLDRGSVTNDATVNGFVLGTDPVNGLSSTTTSLCQNPAIAIVKTNNITVGENGCAPIKVGDKVTYTFTLTNPGNVSLHNVNIIDPHEGLSAIVLQTGDTNTNNVLEVNEIWIYTADYIVNQADIDAGSISNQASVNAVAPNETPVSDQSGNSSNTNEPNLIPICNNPAIAIVKTNNITVGENGCAPIKVGDKITYTFTVTNPGNVSLHNVNIVDLHPGLSAIVLQSGDLNTNNILEVNEIWMYTADYTVTQADIDAGSISNQASVNAVAPNETPVSDQSGNSSNTNEPNLIPICNNPAIAIVKTNNITVGENGCAPIKVGDKITYTFTVTNPGNVSLHNVNIVDLHPGLSAIVLQSGDLNTNNILEVNEIWMYTADYTVTQADIDAGSISNQASVNALAPNETPVSDQSGNSSNTNEPNVIPICNNPAIAIVKTNNITVGENGCAPIKVGDKITYTFTVTNPGNVSLHNVNIVDLHPGLSTIVLQSGDLNTNNILEVNEIWMYTADYTVTQADIDAGSISNQASVNAVAPNETPVSDQSGNNAGANEPNVIPICTNSGIVITKDGNYIDSNQDGITNVGDHVTYNFVITNTGSVTLSNITVTDNNAVVVGGPIQSLAPGATDSTTFTASHAITQADINKGFVYNLALVTAKDPKENEVTDTSSDPTPCTSCPRDPECTDCTITVLIQTPSISITKDGTYVDTNQNGITNVGEHITYTFVVRNTGNVTLSNITITDPMVAVTGGPILSLAPGATDSTTFTASYNITQADINAGLVYNLALAKGTPPVGPDVTATSTDPTPCTSCPIDPECTDCTITVLTQTPRLDVEKTATVTSRGSQSDVYSFVGDVIQYTINVTNSGNVTINNIVVKDPLTGLDTTNETFSLAPGEQRQFMQNYTITLDDMRADGVTNIATANGVTPNNTPVSGEDTLVVEKAGVLGCGTILVHNAFSPNGDEFNEIFKIDNIEDVLCYPENTVEIYNRWGILVYETKGYNNADKAFKGFSEGRVTVDKSAGLPTGTYFYILKYTAVGLQGETLAKQQQGYLYLTR